MGSGAIVVMGEVTRDGFLVSPFPFFCIHRICWLSSERLPGAKVPSWVISSPVFYLSRQSQATADPQAPWRTTNKGGCRRTPEPSWKKTGAASTEVISHILDTSWWQQLLTKPTNWALTGLACLHSCLGTLWWYLPQMWLFYLKIKIT